MKCKIYAGEERTLQCCIKSQINKSRSLHWFWLIIQAIAIERFCRKPRNCNHI